METINNLTNTASKAIWGENNTNTTSEEPVSGLRGDEAKGEPYDAGNMENPSKRVEAEGASLRASDEGQVFNSEGPRPLATIAHENGGDAGNQGKPDKDTVDTQSISSKSSSSGSSSSYDGGGADGLQTKSHGRGTGELHVRSSGLQADGGNFDASKPGAGREADRLMEQKGFKKEDSRVESAHDQVADSSGGSKEKKGLGKKIKEKLHRH